MRYQVIYADPPWSYNDKMSGHSFSLDHEYETQDIEWIKNLPVNDIAEKNSYLFLWAVSPQLPEALQVVESWGFKYKTVGFCWVKEYRDGGLFVKNLGRHTMGGMELCLLATKGSPQRIDKTVRQIVFAPRGEHSKKPDEVRNRIVKLTGDSSRVELFARQKTQDWDVWGDEVESSINLSSRDTHLNKWKK